MFSLIRYYYRKATLRPEKNLAILGLDAAGKTSILNEVKRLAGAEPTEPVLPTIGQNVMKLQFKGFHYTVWDLGGQPNNRVIWKYYLAELDGFMFVVDSSDEMRFAESMRELKKLADDPELEFCIVAVLANKQDIPEALSGQMLSLRFDLAQTLKGRSFEVFETSAAVHQGMSQALAWLDTTFHNDPIARQRAQWRARRAKEAKEAKQQ